MNYPIFFDTKNSLNLFNLEENFRFMSELYSKNILLNIYAIAGRVLGLRWRRVISFALEDGWLKT